jgi:predicted phosphodiesterase
VPNAKAPELRVFSVEDTTVQVTWSRLPPGELALRTGDSFVATSTDGGAGALTLTGLEPDRRYQLRAVGSGLPKDGQVLRFRTLAPPPGAELARLATVSDMHIGVCSFDVAQRMVERLGPGEEAHPIRCTRAAIDELLAWGAERLVVKGDLTDRAAARQWAAVGKLFAALPIPVHAIAGNHDLKPQPDSLPLAEGSALAGFRVSDEVEAIDLPGLRIVLAPTVIPGHSRGHLTASTIDAVADLASDAGTPCMLIIHHELQRLPVNWFWPPGIPSGQAAALFRSLSAANPRTFITSGHTHRHRRRHVGPLVMTEVGSPKDYPGTWAGYVVHEGGIRQVVRRVEAPDCIAWTEYTRAAALGAWGHWSPGKLSARCFSHTWPPT